MESLKDVRREAVRLLDIDLTCCLEPAVRRVDEGPQTLGGGMFYVQCATCKTAARLVLREDAARRAAERTARWRVTDGG